MTTTSAYNYVNWSNMNSFTNFITNANQSGGGFLFTAIDFLVFIVLFITLTAQFGWQSALLSSAFIGMILSLLFVYMGVMNVWIVGAFVGMLVIMFLYLAWKNNNG